MRAEGRPRRLLGIAVALVVGAAGPRSAQAVPPLVEARARYEAGEYEHVVATLRPAVEEDRIVDPVDRAQALRLYGIACVLTDQRLAAEAAFTRWLALEPRARLDPTLVRPEVVLFFEGVRAAHRDELLRDIERRRPRTLLLNLLPPAGQYQNGEHAKFAVLLALEVALGAASIGSWVALDRARRPDGTVADEPAFASLRAGNWFATAALGGAVLYAVVDGLVTHARILRRIESDEDGLRADATAPARRRAPPAHLRASATGLALAF